MIAKTSSGANFLTLGRYLAAGRSGTEQERVAWSVGRNLPVDDPEVAATIMRATAQQSARVERPVYHLSISFDPNDQPTRAMMEAVADRVLHRLGLAEHQAVLVAHTDHAHAHVHVMVNRVHPDTGRAWERWHDRPVIEEVLRAFEREHGLTRVAGRLAESPEVTVPDRRSRQGLTDGERQLATRGHDLLIERVRHEAAHFRTATSWRALETMLAESGWHLARRGQGLVIGDGQQYVKASRIGREFSLRHLEHRFGVAYDKATLEPLLPDRIADGVRAVRTLDGLDAHHAAQYVIRMRADEARESVQRLGALVQRKHGTGRAFLVALAPVYRDLRGARRAFEATATVRGVDAAVTLLRTTPEVFGTLRTTTEHRGLLHRRTTSDALARRLAPEAALRGREAFLAARNAPSRDAIVAARRANWRVQRHHQAVDGFGRALEGRAIAESTARRVLQGAMPDEMQRIQRLLTPPQVMVLQRVQHTVRDVALGRDSHEH